MSFSFEFHCAPSDVTELLKKTNAPESICAYVAEAASKLTTPVVLVRASGHLHDGTEHDNKVSSASIWVEPVTVHVPD